MPLSEPIAQRHRHGPGGLGRRYGGRNAASISITAPNQSLSGTLKFYRPSLAFFRGYITTGSSSVQVIGTMVFE